MGAKAMNWPGPPLVLGIFKRRLHRFGAIVQVRGRREYCHVTNSGRLRELLYPGAKVALMDHGPRPDRKTRYAVRLARYKNKWVCIEANVAPKLLQESWQKGLIPSLAHYDQLRPEVPLDRHTRFDFHAKNSRTGEQAWIEVKCVTLVGDKGIARFPDAPSERASKHLRELMSVARKPKTEAFVFFIVQNPLGRAVGPKDDTDPLFGKTLRQAARSRVRLEAYRAEMNLRGACLRKEVKVLLEGLDPK